MRMSLELSTWKAQRKDSPEVREKRRKERVGRSRRKDVCRHKKVVEKQLEALSTGKRWVIGGKRNFRNFFTKEPWIFVRILQAKVQNASVQT